MLELGVVLRKSRRPGSLATSTLVASAALARRPAPFESDLPLPRDERASRLTPISTCSVRRVRAVPLNVAWVLAVIATQG
jgi:hypothetical protein